MDAIFRIVKNPLVQILVAILIGWFFYSIGQKEPEPVYALEKYQVFADIQGDVPELRLLWNDKPINNFYSSRVAIWNAGDDYIDSSRLSSLDPMRIVVPPSINLLSFSLSSLSREDLAVSVTRSEFNSQTIIQINLDEEEALEPNDGFAVKIYFTSDQPSDFTVEGRVKGVSEGFSIRDWGQEFKLNKLNWMTWLMLVVAFMLSVDGFRDSYRTIKYGRKSDVLNFLPRAIGGPMFFFGLVYYSIIPGIFGMAWLS
ncbi:hypothetical protein [Pseudoalteromonas sp. DY56-GL79]|uniref:hypothetical protein n=1 Tax=Pseudoalteromonas sp. DY56-GL79 TaxID=2967131 RepID=UPI003529D697